jgi:hypothetical protein
MLTPIVTEIPRTLNAVAHDTFIDEAREVMPHSRERSRHATTRTRVPAQADVGGAVTQLPVAAAPAAGARSVALTRAA